MNVINYFVSTLQHHPEIAIYLTIAIGFWLGKAKIGGFSLGVVTTTLLAGLLIGQLGIEVPSAIQSTFFAMFLFAVGYAVGPEFIRALRSDGMPQVIFSVIVCLSGLGIAVLLGKLLHYNASLTAGLMSGGYTNSTVLGVATDLLGQKANTPEARDALALLPVAYAVTYPFGTAGSAWFLASFVPRIFKFNLPKACREYEEAHGSNANAGTTAYHEYTARAFHWNNPELAGLSVGEIEKRFGNEIFVRRVRHEQNGEILDCTSDTIISNGAVVAVSGPMTPLLSHGKKFGPEVKDVPLLDFSTEMLDVVVTNRDFAGRKLGEIMNELFGEPGRGLFLTEVTRSDLSMPANPDMEIHRGDVLTVLGAKKDVARISRVLGYADRPVESSDMAFMGFGIVIGSLLGAITIHVAGIPLSFGTSVGAIVAGIVCGYMRSSFRTFGRIPAPALWVFNNVGLNGFIAVIGLRAASGFVSGLQHYGITLFLAGMAVTMVPLIVGVLLGHFVFKFHPGVMVGACAGARSTTAALGAVLEASQSKVPSLGYTIGYATSRVVMAVLTIVVVNIFPL